MKKIQQTNKDIISRRRFFKWSLFGLVSVMSFSWIDIIRKVEKISAKSIKTISINGLGNGVHFFEEVILIKSDKDLKLYSAICPHMSCFINKTIDDRLICPCHGSSFDLNGNILKGPAANSLQQLEYSSNGNQIKIVL